jgi:hypothetical protein
MTKNIFVTSFLRSGSTHVKVSLSRLLDYRQATTICSVGARGTDEQNISISAAQILFPIPAQVFHQHTKATGSNLALLERFGFRPVVMVRSVPDCLVSLRERLLRTPDVHPGLYYPPEFVTMSKEDQLTWLVYNVAPWFWAFYESWENATIPRLFVRYEEFYTDQIAGIRRILDHVGIVHSFTDADIDVACNHRDGRFNQGRVGRGKEEIPAPLLDVLAAQADAWPSGCPRSLL